MSYDVKQETGVSFLNVVNYIERLFSKDGLQRKSARRQLEKYGKYVTPFLIGVLKSKNVDARWEAAKALIAIKDPVAADALAEALMDEDFEIRWLAAEALIALGKDAVEPLLRKLLSHYDSTYLRIGAHHVMEFLKKAKSLEDDTEKVLDELCAIAPPEPYPRAAKRALDALRRKKKKQRTPDYTAAQSGKGQSL